jgi:glycosyltransferase involved in cell wall biosynthesis
MHIHVDRVHPIGGRAQGPAPIPWRRPLRVEVVDPSAFTPPYDHALSAGLARAGAEVELVTSRFLYGPVPREDGYEVNQLFYRRTAERGLDARGRRALKLAEHVPDMLRFGRHVAERRPDIVHWQWVSVPALDRFLVARPKAGGSPRPPQVFTVHYPLPSGRRALAGQRGLLGRMDAVIAHSEHGAERLRTELGLDPERVHVIEHGAFDYLTQLPDERPLPDELRDADGPVILFFGLLRPYKGIDVLLEAFRSVEGAELWIVGRAMMDLDPLRELARRTPGRVRILPRFITDPEIPALFRRADLVALPYREIEQSGVLYTGLAFGKPLVIGAVGGFTEVAARGAARLVPPGDPEALAKALNELLADEPARGRLAHAAATAAAGPYSWDAVAERTLALYRSLLTG